MSQTSAKERSLWLNHIALLFSLGLTRHDFMSCAEQEGQVQGQGNF